jgi:hypothetical protein
MSNIIRKFEKSVALNKGLTLKKEPLRKGHTGFLSCREIRLLNVPLIYGLQGEIFENGVDPKPWQHGPYYDKYNIDGHPLDISIKDHKGNLVYVRLHSGQLVNTTKNRAKARLEKQMRKQVSE